MIWGVNRPTRFDLEFAADESGAPTDLEPTFEISHEPKLAELYGTGVTAALDRPKFPYSRDVVQLVNLLQEPRK